MNLIPKKVYYTHENEYEKNKFSKIIEFNKVVISDTYEKEIIRNWLWTYGDFVRNLQNYYFSINDPIHKIMGKLFTRIWWLYNDSANFVK